MTYDPNEARDQKGKWTAGGGAPDADDDAWDRALAKTKQNDIDEDARRVKLAADIVARDLNYDPSLISVRTDEMKFQLNGATYDYAGAAHLDTGKIELFAQHVSASSIPEVTAHEIGHQKFQAFFNDYLKESAQFTEATKTLPSVMEAMKPDGTLRPGWAEKFPLYEKYTEVMMPSITEGFAKSDGITPYSAQWWVAWQKGTANTQQAFHETLAEMTAQKYVQGPSYDEESEKFKAAGYSLDMGHDYSVRKWKTDIKVDPADLPPALKASFDKLQASAGKSRRIYGRTPAPEWIALYNAVNEHWEEKHPHD